MKAYKETIRKYYKYQYSDWTQPILSANGIMGGSSYACDRDSIVHGQEAFQAFDGNDSTYWWSGAGFPHWITFYSPVPIKVTHMYMWSGSNYNTQGVLQGSNDNTTWTDLISWSNAGQTKDFDIPNSNYYQYYRCYVTNGTYTHTLINTITFTATQRTIAEGNSSDYDFYEDIEVYKLPAKVDRTFYKLFYMCEVAGTFTSSGWQKTDKGTHYIHGEANAYELRNNPTVTSTYTWNTPIPARTYVYNLNVTGQGNGYYNNPTVTITYENGSTEVVFSPKISINNYNSNFSFEAKYPVKSISIQGTLTYTSVNYVWVYMSLASQSFISTQNNYDYYEDKPTYYAIGE